MSRGWEFEGGGSQIKHGHLFLAWDIGFGGRGEQIWGMLK